MIRRPPRSTRTDTLFPYTTLFRSRLRGESSGFKRAGSGHIYLCLKDDNAVIDGVMWKGGAARLPFAPQDGVEVIATGKLNTYPGRSKYQIVIDRMELAGQGAMMALVEKLNQKPATAEVGRAECRGRGEQEGEIKGG